MGENNEAIAKYYIKHPELLKSFLDEVDKNANELLDKKPIKIIVDIQGWMVQAVFSTDPNIEVTVIDWDNIKNDDGYPEMEYINQGDYSVDVVTEQEIEEKIAEANKFIKKNIEEDLERR